MKFLCAIPGLEANWIEFSDIWTRREGKDLFSLPEQKSFDKYVPLKCVACHIEATDGTTFTDPATLKYDDLDDLDARLFGFVARALYSSYVESVALGNASARLSSDGVERMTTTARANRTH